MIDSDLREFAKRAKEEGVKSKSAFVRWFRTDKGGSASQDRLHQAWNISDTVVDETLKIQKELEVIYHAQSSDDTNTNKLKKEYQLKYTYGSFILNKDEKISSVLSRENVPNDYGIYIVYSVKDDVEKIIYIGKSGTLQNNGAFKSQGLNGRLKAVGEKNISRNVYFQNVIREHDFDCLKFEWIVTVNDLEIEIPALAESIFLQEYFNENIVLPLLNKSI